MELNHQLNEQIKASRVLLLSKDGEKEGEMSLAEAMKKAEEQQLDLMQVGGKDGLAICKILNYESWLYHEQKKKHKQEQKNKPLELKVMNFRPVTDEHDFNLKIKKITEFLSNRHKVKIAIRMKSREGHMKNLNDAFIKKIMDSLQDVGEADSNVSWSHREINFIVKPSTKLDKKNSPAPK